MGGKDKYNARLDAYFAGDYNWHSNEPSHHVGYLYDFGGEPWNRGRIATRSPRNRDRQP
jgi:putative alpha-1,2-mannosidase